MAKKATAASPAARITELRKQLDHHNHLYYVENAPVISDLEFDALLRELTQLEKENPSLVSADSPTQRVGGSPIAAFESVKHRVPMLSIDNTVGAENLREWDAGVRKLLGKRPVRYTVEPKIDGVAISLTYVNGVLSVGVTRGDGKAGDDVTHNLKTIAGVPLKLRTDKPPKLFEARGEIYMSKADFARLNQENESRGEKTYANPRNLAAGSLKLLDPRECAARKLRLFAYSTGALDGIEFRSHLDVMKKLKEFGFPVPDVVSFDKVDDLVAYCADWDTQPEPASGAKAKRFSLPYDIDGLVVKVDDLEQREQMGSTAKHVRWATAFKFTAEQGITKVLDVVIHVGKYGEQTPVLTLSPVQLCGTTVQHVSMHNAAQMKQRDVRIGDTVVVVKRGEIIPYVEQSLPELRTDKVVPYVFPSKCPACGAATKLNEGGNGYLCTATMTCPAQLQGRIESFAKRTRMDISGLGETMAEKLVASGLVKNVQDLFALTLPKLMKLEAVGQLSAQNLLDGIEACKSRGLGRLLSGLNIYGVAESMAANLARAYPSIDLLLAAKKEQLASTEGFGPTRAESVYNYFHSPAGEKLVADLRAAGVKMTEDAPAVTGSAAVLAGKTVVVTGTLISYKRNDIEKMIVDLGGKAAGSVSKNTSFVVVGTDAGSKLDKARALGIKTISEEEFDEMIRQLQAAAGPAAPVAPPPPSASAAAPQPVAAKSQPLAGKTIVVTGTLMNYDRKSIEAKIESLGGKCGSSVSKNTSLVIAGDDAGSKRAKAESLGVKVISEEEFEEMVG